MVGKSTVSLLLALGLKNAGASVGLLDADIYGPSIPKMVGAEDEKPAIAGDMIMPPQAFGMKVMSMGFMLDPDKVVVWRGPMVHGVVKQFLEQVNWGELDYLIVDLPPGTGDAPLTLSQSIPMTGSVTVCTPQDIALLDARRAVKMYEQLNVPCLGIVENMSYYICPSCGHRDELFDHGGARKAAGELGRAVSRRDPAQREAPAVRRQRHAGQGVQRNRRLRADRNRCRRFESGGSNQRSRCRSGSSTDAEHRVGSVHRLGVRGGPAPPNG